MYNRYVEKIITIDEIVILLHRGGIMLKFMDFCAGIGGGRLGLELNGLTCIGHSEIDKNPSETYKLFLN